MATLPRVNRRLPLAFALLRFASGYFLGSAQCELRRAGFLCLDHQRPPGLAQLENPRRAEGPSV